MFKEKAMKKFIFENENETTKQKNNLAIFKLIKKSFHTDVLSEAFPEKFKN